VECLIPDDCGDTSLTCTDNVCVPI
jgi:hypothetical protein